MDWNQVLATALPTIVLVGGTLLRTHGKVKEVLRTLDTVLNALANSTPENPQRR